MSGPEAPSAGSDARYPTPRWTDPGSPDPDVVGALARDLGLPAPICAILAARGLTDATDAKAFLRPRLEHLFDPGDLADGYAAAERIARAVTGGERILVHGDYDVDGVCGTALLTRWLRSLGGDVVPFVPHRLRDGYDFSDAGLRRARDEGVGLVVTVDCGTVAHGPIERAGAEGIDVVVTDHHAVGGPLPPALAVVNPQRTDCPYPDKGLCGAGIAYKVGVLAGRALGRDTGPLVEYLDLVALATVADLVPLRGENRILVSYGLRRFAESRIPGLQALLEVADVDPGDVNAGQLGFRVGPRINAAGRLGDAGDALRLLLTDDRDEAAELSRRLDELNTRRRDEDERTLEEALRLLDASFDPDRDFGVVLAAEGWHPGVIGIVASRVVERIHRPVVLVALDGDGGRGSARSIPGFHLYDALRTCAPHLGRFGGHAQAAGMDVSRASLEAFRAAFSTECHHRLAGTDLLRPTLRPDIEIELADVDLPLVHWMGYLGPHGVGNPGPLLMARGVSIDGPRTVGERHLKARVAREGSHVEAIGFGLSERYPPDALPPVRHDVLFRLSRNEWRGRVSAQAVLVDLRPSAEEARPVAAAS